MSEVKTARNTYAFMVHIPGTKNQHVTFEVFKELTLDSLETIFCTILKTIGETKMTRVSIQTDGKGLERFQKRAQAVNPKSFNRSNKNGTITGDLNKNPLKSVRVMLVGSSEIAKLRKALEPFDSKRDQRTMTKSKYIPHIAIKQWSDATNLAHGTVLTSTRIVIRNHTDRSKEETDILYCYILL
jgi:hypothetical protein